MSVVATSTLAPQVCTSAQNSVYAFQVDPGSSYDPGYFIGGFYYVSFGPDTADTAQHFTLNCNGLIVSQYNTVAAAKCIDYGEVTFAYASGDLPRDGYNALQCSVQGQRLSCMCSGNLVYFTVSDTTDTDPAVLHELQVVSAPSMAVPGFALNAV